MLDNPKGINILYQGNLQPSKNSVVERATTPVTSSGYFSATATAKTAPKHKPDQYTSSYLPLSSSNLLYA